MKSEQVVRLAAKLYEYRDAARFLLGERYAEVIGHYQHHIRQVMDREGCDEIPAAMKLCEVFRARGEPPSATIAAVAAAVEMVEGTR